MTAFPATRNAEQARADLNALNVANCRRASMSCLNARADEISLSNAKPLAAGVAAAKQPLTPRQINERAAREEIDTLVREHEATFAP